MKCLERIIGSALIGFVSLSASAQDSKPVVVLRDDPKLTAAVSYYMPVSVKKDNLSTPDPDVTIKKMGYTGNSRGRTEVIAICSKKGEDDFAVELNHYGDDNKGKFSFQYVSDSPNIGFLLSTYFLDGKVDQENLLAKPAHRVPVENKDEWNSARADRDKWTKILGFDDFKKLTVWHNAKDFFVALPTIVDNSHYDISITHANPDESWVRPSVEAKLKDGFKDSVSLIDFHELIISNRLVVEWVTIDKDNKETTFHAEFIDNEKDGSLDSIDLGSDKLETFSKSGDRFYYIGEVPRPYSDDDTKAIFMAAENKWRTISNSFNKEVVSSRTPEKKESSK